MKGEYIALFIALLVVVMISGSVLLFLIGLAIGFVRDVRDKIILSFKRKADGTLQSRYEKYFLGHFSYYDKLPDDLRLKFLIRVRKFIRCKKFESRSDFELTEQHKALIAGAAIQLTFGLEEFTLDHFSRIIIYPDSYYSHITGKFHMGEANPRGVIVISWKDFIKGYSIPDDTYNVGLHEMAHALELEKRLGGDYDTFFANYYEKWKKITEEEFEKLREDGDSFFRSYAGTNRHEFFAVSVEHFFEKSREFKEQLPQVYNHLCILLNQDPMSKDTRIQQTDQKSKTEILEETTLLNPIHEFTSAPGSTNAIMFLLCLVMAFYIYYISKNFKIPLILLSYFLISIGFPLFFKNKIILNEKYISIAGFKGKVKAILPFDKIIFLSYMDRRRGPDYDGLSIAYVREGEIRRYNFRFSLDNKDKITLANFLNEKNVIFRN